MIRRLYSVMAVALVAVLLAGWVMGASLRTKRRLSMEPKPIQSDHSVTYDYDIVYVRAPRHGDERQIMWAEVFNPFQGEPGSDLVVLHPDGREEVLVAAGDDAIADPYVSFDAQWVYFARFHNSHPFSSGLVEMKSSDIYKVNVASKKVVQLTHQEFTPNLAATDPALPAPPVFNLGPSPLPDGRIVFTSNRNGFISTKDYHAWVAMPGYTSNASMQLFTMDDDGSNVEMIGSLNINGALHPSVLKDGRVMFSTFESEGLRDPRTWAMWLINPDGTGWGPLFSGLGPQSDHVRHFATQTSDGSLVSEEYYFEKTLGFGTLYKMDASAPKGQPYFSSADRNDPRSVIAYGAAGPTPMPFTPRGAKILTPFTNPANAPAPRSDLDDPKSAMVGRFTHPTGAPDNHLLVVWSPGPTHGFIDGRRPRPGDLPTVDSGIYLIKNSDVIDEPSQMLLIKNDPNFNEQWPRPLVPYKRIYGVDQPEHIAHLANDGNVNRNLPQGTPFGLVGTASVYKRESYPLGVIPPGKVTAEYGGGKDPYTGMTSADFIGGNDPYKGLGALAGIFSYNWDMQGADSGYYTNDDVHAIRIVITEPTTDPKLADRTARRWWNVADERLRILGEFPVRKFRNGKQPIDPDGNPDTSFLAKLPADVAWTFQTLDKNGMVLNMAQTWHQLRPGEERNDCGGCHAHSQVPTPWEKTRAAQSDYKVFDLTKYTPLLTSKKNDQSGQQWDEKDETGVRFQAGIKDVEYYRDVKPILDRSCIACHTQKWKQPAGNLVLDDNELRKPDQADRGLIEAFSARLVANVPGTYIRLAMDPSAHWGYKPGLEGGYTFDAWPFPQASRYIRYMQSRRSLLAWKIFGKRMDGFKNEDFAYEQVPGDRSSLIYHGQPFNPIGKDRRDTANRLYTVNLAYLGTAMPPPDAVAGTYKDPNGKLIKVPGLSDEDRRTIVRWIDLGCPIDLDYDQQHPARRGRGWLAADNRPTLTLTAPRPNANEKLTRILVGMHSFDAGLDLTSFDVTADFAVNGIRPGQNLASQFRAKGDGVWELVLSKPLAELQKGKLNVAIKDKEGNATQIQRTFSVGTSATAHRIGGAESGTRAYAGPQ